MPSDNNEQVHGSPSSEHRLRVERDDGNHYDVSPDRYAPHLSEFYSIVNSKKPVASNAGSDDNDHLDDMHHLRSSKVYSKARRGIQHNFWYKYDQRPANSDYEKRCQGHPRSPVDFV